MAVYDEQDQRSLTDDDLRDITGINPEQERAMNGEASTEGPSGSAKDILGRERAAAVGRPQRGVAGSKQADGAMRQKGNISSGNSPGLSSKLDSFGTGVRDKLKSKESSEESLYKPSKNNYPQASRRQRIRKRVTIAGALAGILGGGGGFAMFGTISGPLQFLHAGELFSQFHLDEKDDQGNSRVLKMGRNIRYTLNGQYERTRLGFLGNRLANRVEKKLNAHGVTSIYDNGKFLGYSLDPKKTGGTELGALDENNTAEKQKAFLKDTLAIDSVVTNTTEGKRVVIPSTGSYFQDKKIMKTTIRLSGVRYTGPISNHVMGKRNLITWHPIERLSGKADEKYRAWVKEQYKKIKLGVKTPTATATGATDDKGKPVQGTGDGVDTINEINQQGSQVGADLAEGKTESLGKFKGFLQSKLTGGALGAIGVGCLIVAIADHIDELNQINVVVPMIRMGMQAVTLAAQITSGLDVDIAQLGFFSGLYFGKSANQTTKSSWVDAKSVQAERGQPLSGTDIPPTARLDQQGNFFTAIRDSAIGQQFLKPACDILAGAVGIILTIAIGLVAPVGTIIQTALGAVVAAVAVDLLANYFSAETVSVTAAGMDRGNFMNYGVRLAGNDIGVSRGGLALSDADSKVLADATKQSQDEQFKQHDLAYRLFDSSDPKSFFSKVIDNQAPSASDNVAHVATGFLNLGKTFGSILAKPLMQKAGAFPLKPYNYGFPDIGFNLAEMNDGNFDNPFQNAELAAEILDANSAAEPLTNAIGEPNPNNYIARAKACFGIDIVKQAFTPPGGGPEVMQYAVKPPTPGATITTATVVDANNKFHCNEGHQTASLTPENGKQAGKSVDIRPAAASPWSRVRFFTFDSQMMNSWACYEGEDQTPEDKQACIDAGVLADPGAGAVSGGGGESGEAIPTGDLPGWKMIFADDFTVPAALGSWGSECDASKVVYNGTGPVGATRWVSYPNCFRDTYDKRPYRADQVLDVSGGDLNFHLHNVNGQPAGANPSPVLPASGAGVPGDSQYQTYGRYVARFKTTPGTGDMSEYYLAWLLWPSNESQWQCAESDYPEGSLNDNTVSGFHHSCAGQAQINGIPNKFTDWHDYTQEWMPGARHYYVDKTELQVDSRPVYAAPERWQLQTETKGNGNSDGYLHVDWVVVYCPANACKIGG